jgi:hypothetical protein
MARRLVTLLVVASLAGFVFAVAGCGGNDNSSSSDTTTATTPTTETTSTDTTSTSTDTTSTSTTSTDTTSASGIATAANCQEFAQIGSKLAGAFSGSGDVQKAKESFDQLVAAAPSEIKGDFQTIADAYTKIADALQGYDASSGQAPSAAVLAKLTALSTELDQTKLTQASQNISKWATENCTG